MDERNTALLLVLFLFTLVVEKSFAHLVKNTPFWTTAAVAGRFAGRRRRGGGRLCRCCVVIDSLDMPGPAFFFARPLLHELLLLGRQLSADGRGGKKIRKISFHIISKKNGLSIRRYNNVEMNVVVAWTATLHAWHTTAA